MFTAILDSWLFLLKWTTKNETYRGGAGPVWGQRQDWAAGERDDQARVVGGVGWEANLGWQAWGAGSSGPEMSIHADLRLGAAAGRGSLLSRGDAPGQTWCKQCSPGTGGELLGGMRWGDWGQIQPPCRQQKRGARLFLGTHLGSRFKWPLPVGPLSYINLDYMMFIDNFGTWVYNDTQFLIQEQDSFPLLQFLLLGSSFQFRSYRSCTSLLSVFWGVFLKPVLLLLSP